MIKIWLIVTFAWGPGLGMLYSILSADMDSSSLFSVFEFACFSESFLNLLALFFWFLIIFKHKSFFIFPIFSRDENL